MGKIDVHKKLLMSFFSSYYISSVRIRKIFYEDVLIRIFVHGIMRGIQEQEGSSYED
jgi:hypothetical protein